MRKQIRLGGILVLLMLQVSALMAQFEATKPLPTDPNVKIGKLANGLTYYIHKNALPAKKIQLRLVVNAGSILETPDQQGLAHFMEHMNFNGLKHFPKNELVSYLQSIGVEFGADLNAYTSFDETVYILPIPADDSAKVEKGFTILEDWAFNALLDTAEINKERGVVLEESRLSKGAGARMQKQYFPILFNGSAYSNRLPIGKDSILQNFKPSSLINFYKTWYRPNLMSVVVVGDIDPAAAEKLIVRHFAGYKNPAKIVPRPAITPIPERKGNKSIVLTDKEQPYNILQVINYVEKAQPVKTWGDYRNNIVEGLFNQMVSQRFSEIAQQPNSPFLAAGATFSDFIRGYNSFSSYAVLGDKPAQPAVRALESVTESVKKFGFLPAELERAKVNVLNGAERANKDKDKTQSDRFVDAYVSNFLSGEPILGIENRYQYLKSELSKITVEEINALAKRTETQQGFFTMLMGAEKSKSSLPAADTLIHYVTAARAIPAQPYQEKVLAKTLIDRIPVAGKIVQESKDAALGTTNLTLSNGITVTLKPTDFKNDEIQMDSWRWGGSHVYPIEDKMNADKASTLVRSMGVKDFSPTDLRKFLAGKTVQVTPYISADDEGIEGSSSLKDVETFFQLIHVYFTQPRKDASLFQNFVNSQKSILQNMKSNPRSYFSDTLNKVIYNNHPYAPVMESPDSYDKLNLDRSLAIYKEVFSNADGLHFTFVGNIDIDKMKTYITTYLGSLPARTVQHAYKDVGLRPVQGPLNLNVNKGAEKQSLVVLQYSGEMPYSKETDLQLTILSEVMNIKIIEKLREDMGGIYGGGMGGGLTKRPYEHYSIGVSFPCGPENVDKLVAAFLGIVKDVSDKGIDEKDMAKVKETLKKQYEVQIKNNDYWLERLSSSFIDQTDPAWILAYPAKVEGVTAAQLQQLCKKLMDTPNYSKSVLYPEK
ncbi:MAG: insulinase family protein [Bacteroidetes bacterium]|nr:insulinase family protein [Bacteroidota bacterium]